MNSDLESMLEDIEKRSEHLDEWQEKFIDSVSRQIRKTGSVTDRQRDVIEKLWERVTSEQPGD